MLIVDANIMSVVESQKLYKVNIKNGNGMKIPNVPPYIEGEHIWSYLSRLADMNGFDNTDRFLCELSSTSERKHWRNFQKFPYDASTPIIGNMLEIDGKEDWVVSTTLADALRISESLNAQGIRVRRYSEDVIRDGGFIFTGGNIVTRMKICPECRKEDIKTSMFHYHLVHQLPEMTVCPLHGCALEEFRGEHGAEMSDTSSFSRLLTEKIDLKYACSCNSILKANITSSLQDLIWCIQSRFPNGSSLLKNVSPYLISNWRRLNSFDFPELVKTLTSIFGEVDAVIAELRSTSSSFQHFDRLFIKAIEERFIPVSPLTWGYVKLECVSCGKNFHASPQSIIAGMGCPCCEARLSRSERIEAMYSFHDNGEWKFDRAMETTNHMVNAFHIPSGLQINAPVWSFLYAPLLPEPCAPLNMAKSKQMSEEDRNRLRKERVETSLSRRAGFDLIAITGYDVNTKLTLRHQKCGGTFEVYKTNFDASPFCRLCEGRHIYDEEDIKKQISEKSGGVFEWCGRISDSDIEWKATDGKKTLKASCLQEILEKVRRIGTNGWKKRNLGDVHTQMDDYIAARHGEILFCEDFIPLFEEPRMISNYLHRLSRNGVLTLADHQTYWHVGESHTPYEVMERKFGNRYGVRHGFPICDSLFFHLGFIDIPTRSIYALPNPHLKDKHHEKRIVIDTPIDIFYFKGNLSCADWRLLAFIMTIKYKKYTTNWDESLKKKLVIWIHESGFDEKDLAIVEENFPKHIIRECMQLLFQETFHG